MTMSVSGAAAAAVLAIAFAAQPATAATITFGSASNGPQTNYSEAGLTFDVARIVSGNCPPPAAGNAPCLALNDNEVSVLTRTGGGTFSLTSFWFELLGRGSGGRTPITNTLTVLSNLGGLLNLTAIVYDHNDGGQVFDLSQLALFQNVTSLTFRTSEGGNVRIDDLTLAGNPPPPPPPPPSPVPLPASGLLLAAALGLLASRRRKD